MIICLILLSILSTKVNAQHFNFEGGNPSALPWTIYLAEATLNSIDLEAGDEIAIFDGDLMVGAMVLSQVCIPENQFDNVLLAFNILASGNPGYTPGNDVFFKCWDASLEIEISDFEISFDDPYGDAWTQCIFPSNDGEYSITHLSFVWVPIGNITGTVTNSITTDPIEGALVTVEGTSYSAITVSDGTYLIDEIEIGTYTITASAEGYYPLTTTGVEVLTFETTTVDFNLYISQAYNLDYGYQMISSRMISENPDMQNILNGILDNLDFVRNTEGYMLRKIGPNWVNNIGNWVNTEGYIFRMNQTDELIMTGEAIDPQTPIELLYGYQIIGYLPEQALNTEEVFQDVLENLDFVRNTAGLMFRKIGPVWVNSIGNMQPGEGYLVRMNEPDELIYPFICGNNFTDPRDEQTYNTVLIGDQCWMAENLNIGEYIESIYTGSSHSDVTNNGIIEKYCYDNNPENCDEYGGLYDWNEMMQYTTIQGVQGICPIGWHIPTDDEWKVLEGTVDSQYPVGDPIWNTIGWRGYDAGLNLKSTSGWHSNGNGIDIYGFTALPGGYRDKEGDLFNLTYHGTFWSSSESSSAILRFLRYDCDNVLRNSGSTYYGYSVRCIKD